MKVSVDPKVGFQYDMAKSQLWELRENTVFRKESVCLALKPALQEGEQRIEFDTLILRQKKLAGRDFSQKHAEALLADPASIPLEWVGCHIVITGTRWDNLRFIRIPVLHFLKPSGWEIYWRWIEHGFTKEDHLLIAV